MARRLRMAGDETPSDRILSEIVMLAVYGGYVSYDEEADAYAFEVEAWEDHLREKGYTITKTDSSVTFTVVDA